MMHNFENTGIREDKASNKLSDSKQASPTFLLFIPFNTDFLTPI